MRVIIICFLLAGIYSACFAQADTAVQAGADPVYDNSQVSVLDSVASASVSRRQFVSDSLSMIFIAKPDPLRKNQFVEQMLKEHVYHGYGFLDAPSAKKDFSKGIVRKIRDSWVLAVVVFLLLYTAFLRLAIPKDINNIAQSFYNKQLFSQTDDDSSLLSLRAFLALIILLGLTFGLFIYQLSAWYKIYYRVDGFTLFILLSCWTIVLLGLKLLLLKFLGFVFNVGNLAGRYITILCFTYFTITFIFLPVIACLSLLTAQLIPLILSIAVVLTGVILVWLYLRNSLIIISNFRFSKFYLFVYLCALEICPIFILMKALNI